MGEGRSDYQRMLDGWLRKPVSRRTVLKAAVAMPAAAALAACSKGSPSTSGGGSDKGELNVYNWAAYLNPKNLKAFGKDAGVKTTLDFYANNEELIAKLQGGAKGYDIIAPTGYAVEILAASNLLHEIDHSKIPNLSNVDDQFLGVGFDPDNKYSIPKDWGTTGVGWLTDHVDGDITTWRQFFDMASEYSGKYTVLDSSPEVIGAALKLNGFSYNSLDQGEIDKATDDLIAIKGDIASVTSSNYRQMMQNEEAYVALGWNGDFFYVKKPHKYAIPAEGSEFWLDNWCIPSTSDNPEAAHEFINYILQPEVQATETNFTYYASCVGAAQALVDPAIGNDPSIYPPKEVVAKLETAIADPQFLQLRNDAWTRFKAA
jgi:spermidine/putrescine transport system substrate-binding protein